MQASCAVLYSWDDNDLTRRDGHPALRGLRIVNPVPIEPAQQALDISDTAR